MVEAAERRQKLDKSFAVLRRGDVAGDCLDPITAIPSQLFEKLASSSGHDDVRAGFVQDPSEARTESGRGARHERDPIAQPPPVLVHELIVRCLERPSPVATHEPARSPATTNLCMRVPRIVLHATRPGFYQPVSGCPGDSSLRRSVAGASPLSVCSPPEPQMDGAPRPARTMDGHSSSPGSGSQHQRQRSGTSHSLHHAGPEPSSSSEQRCDAAATAAGADREVPACPRAYKSDRIRHPKPADS